MTVGAEEAHDDKVDRKADGTDDEDWPAFNFWRAVQPCYRFVHDVRRNTEHQEHVERHDQHLDAGIAVGPPQVGRTACDQRRQ